MPESLPPTTATLVNDITMSDVADFQEREPHVALLPGAGMGHLVPFLRLAALLASRNCRVTFIAPQPPVSAAESDHMSDFFPSNPHIKRLDFHLPPYNPSDFAGIDDPFFIQFEAISRSVHLLPPLLAALSPPLSGIFTDFTCVAGISQVADDLSIPFCVVSITSARFFSIMACLPHLTLVESDQKFGDSSKDDDIELPGLSSVPRSSLPPPLFTPSHFFAAHIHLNAPVLPKAKGVVFNTFDWLESETITAVNSGRVLPNLPHFLAVGPYESYEDAKGACPSWLDEQPQESVLYVSFGSRTALSKKQLRELGYGLERSGCRFLWVLKASKVDKEEKDEIQDLVGDSFLERTKNKGLVHRGWVNQERILAHPAIGGFLSHCGWNSVTEAARLGVPMLAWPPGGDQKVNAEVAERAGLGMRVRHWSSWGENLVKGEEIGEKIVEFMQDKALRAGAKRVMQEAKHAIETGGSSDRMLERIIDMVAPKKGEPTSIYPQV